MAYPLLRKRIGFALAAGLMASGCYTDPINMTPTVRIDTPLEPVVFGLPAMFTATATDPDGDPPTLEWFVVPKGACPADFAFAVNWPPEGPGWSADSPYTVLAKDTQEPFCVWAKVADRYGAASVDARTFDPTDHAPVAMLSLAAPASAISFPIGTKFYVSAVGSTDVDVTAGDRLTFEMTFKPETTAATLAPCTLPDDASPPVAAEALQCFTAQQPGDYVVHLRVTDSLGESDTADLPLHVVALAPPVAALDLVLPAGAGPFALGSMFQVTSRHSQGSGSAPPVPDWSVERESAPNLPVAHQPCASAASDECFVADVADTYRVGLTVHDAGGTSAPVSATYLVVDDQPPCIDATTPALGMAMTSMTDFAVAAVSDDLDPWPSTKDMQWFTKGSGDTDFQPGPSGFPTFSIPSLSLGEVVRVRLEVHDRNTERSAAAFRACGDADVCTLHSLLHADPCFQRVTWTVNGLPPP